MQPPDIHKHHPLVVLLGPTAVGKTTAAIELARILNGEIISADSRQVYRLMDIGTAKPTLAERAAVPHHLLDIANPDEIINVSRFQHLAGSAITDIHQRHKLPFLVGGTGQFITALIEGWQIPEVAPHSSLRAELEDFAEKNGWEALLQRLEQVDPVTAATIDGKNIRRVIRALEVSIVTGQAFSELRRKSPPHYSILHLGLTMEDRAALYKRADERIDKMIRAGLVEEVQTLVATGYSWNLPAMSSLGYLEIGAYLRGEMSLEESIITLQRATRDFIRRQYTWFRKYNPYTHWFESDEESHPLMANHIQNWLHTLSG